MRAPLPLLLWLAAAACSSSSEAGAAGADAVDAADDAAAPADADATAGDTDDAAPFASLFSFVVMADPHVTGAGDHADRLAAALAWVNSQAEARSIELVLVVGDIAWGAGLPLARELLDALAVPYVPIIGDNEVQTGDEQAFAETFGPVYDALAGRLDSFSRAPLPVAHPAGVDAWLANSSFDHRGVHFATLDFCVRALGGIMGETGELHDYEGGTWPWLAADLAGREGGPADGIVLAAHVPMQVVIFDAEELTKVAALFGRYAAQLYGFFAGHVHVNFEGPLPDGSGTLFVTDATHDGVNTVRLVRVSGNGAAFRYDHERVEVP